MNTANKTATDWTRYYSSVPFTAKLTRKYSTAVLLDMFRRRAVPAAGHDRISVVEMGGANSCFVDHILSGIGCRSYDVIDTNPYGLSLLEQRMGRQSVVRFHQQSVFDLSLKIEADVVFSFGLVEHFEPDKTREAVLAHFSALRPGGIAIISFPTPTWLYRTARRALEFCGMWQFPDERPLELDEVIAAVRERGEVLEQKLLWPLILTQALIIARKPVAPLPA